MAAVQRLRTRLSTMRAGAGTGIVLPIPDRRSAGRALAEVLEARCADREVLVLALPRGGVPVAWEVARRLNAPLDVVLIREPGVHPERNERLYRGDRPRPRVEGQSVILVDDGGATLATLRAAIAALRAQQPDGIVVAMPVGTEDTAAALAAEADEVVYLATPARFWSIGRWYVNFGQVSDGEVRSLLGT